MVFLISGLGYFTFLKPKHKIHNRVGGRKEEQNHGLGLAPSAIREKSVTLCAFYVGQQVLVVVFLTSVDWSPFCPALISRLTPSLDCNLILTALSCQLSLGLSFPRPLPVSWEISRANPLGGFRTKTNKGILWLAPTPKETNAIYRVTRATRTEGLILLWFCRLASLKFSLCQFLCTASRSAKKFFQCSNLSCKSTHNFSNSLTFIYDLF